MVKFTCGEDKLRIFFSKEDVERLGLVVGQRYATEFDAPPVDTDASQTPGLTLTPVKIPGARQTGVNRLLAYTNGGEGAGVLTVSILTTSRIQLRPEIRRSDAQEVMAERLADDPSRVYIVLDGLRYREPEQVAVKFAPAKPVERAADAAGVDLEALRSARDELNRVVRTGGIRLSINSGGFLSVTITSTFEL